MKNIEALELKNMILAIKQELEEKIFILMPEEFSLSYLAQRTGWSRAGLARKLRRLYTEDVDFYMKNSHIVMTRKTALEMIATCPIKNIREIVKCAS
jgi:hypothetical protein